MTQSLPVGLTDCLLWSPEKGYGWHSRPAMLYSGDYFAHYQKLDNTKMGALLTRARLELVGKYCPPSDTVDIGIGGGRYVLESGGEGFDVCKDAAEWLQFGGRYRDPYDKWYGPVKAVTCWDSLEHIPDPRALLAEVKEWLFVSLPVFEDADDVLSSKHYKPGEHLWYFSPTGFINWCAEQGFECVEMNRVESDLGREGIMSFAFKRVAG